MGRGTVLLIVAAAFAITACGDPATDNDDTIPDISFNNYLAPQPEPPPVEIVEICFEGEEIAIPTAELDQYVSEGAYEGLCAIDLSFTTDVGFIGVDDPKDFSLDNSTANLQRDVLSLLEATATVRGFDLRAATNLSHRGTRGLGVVGDEQDEVDAEEYIEFRFDAPIAVWEIEVRSLFTNEQCPGVEQGDVYFLLDDDGVADQHLIGLDPIGTSNGAVTFDYRDDPIIANRIIFFVRADANYSHMSEFAVARVVGQPQLRPDSR